MATCLGGVYADGGALHQNGRLSSRSRLRSARSSWAWASLAGEIGWSVGCRAQSATRFSSCSHVVNHPHQA